MGPTYPPSEWVPGPVKWPGCETDHSHLYRVDNKNVWSFISTHIFLHVTVLNPYSANMENMVSSNNASKWLMGFNSAFEGLIKHRDLSSFYSSV
jgi:hypothetical protein